MNLKQLRYVIVLSEQGSFSKAAEELNISQPSLSQYVRKIEQEIGIELFDRSGSVIRLTDAGREYIAAGRKIIDIEHQLMGRFSDIKDNKSGSLSIGISPHRSVCILPPAIACFRKLYPGIQVSVDERVGQELLDRAERGDYDICIATTPVDEKIFECVSIMDDECILAVPEGSQTDLELRKKSVGMKERKYPAVDVSLLNNREFITLAQPQLMQRILSDICEDYGISIKKPVVCTSLSATATLVAEGVGCALIPSSILNYGMKGISCYSVKQDIPHRNIVVLYRKGQLLSKAVRDLIKILKNEKNIKPEE